MVPAFLVVADQTDVNRDQQHKNQSLYQSNQNLHEIKGKRNQPISEPGREVEHAV